MKSTHKDKTQSNKTLQGGEYRFVQGTLSASMFNLLWQMLISFSPYQICSKNQNVIYILENVMEWGTKYIFCILLFPNHVPEVQKPILQVLACFRMYMF
jgi:hypothetical protein